MDPVSLGIIGGTALFSIGKGIYDTIKAGESQDRIARIMAAKKPTITAGPAISAPPPPPPAAAPPPVSMTATAGPSPMPAPYTPPVPEPAPGPTVPPPGGISGPMVGAETPSLQTGFGAAPQEPQNPWLAYGGQKFTPGGWV